MFKRLLLTLIILLTSSTVIAGPLGGGPVGGSLGTGSAGAVTFPTNAVTVPTSNLRLWAYDTNNKYITTANLFSYDMFGDSKTTFETYIGNVDLAIADGGEVFKNGVFDFSGNGARLKIPVRAYNTDVVGKIQIKSNETGWTGGAFEVHDSVARQYVLKMDASDLSGLTDGAIPYWDSTAKKIQWSGPIDDAYWHLDPLTSGETQWVGGINNDSVGDNNDLFELRSCNDGTCKNAGVGVRFSVSPDGDVVVYGDLTVSGSSGFQPLNAILTDISDGTITTNLVNTAYPWADNEVANVLTLDELTLTERTSAPGTPAAKKLYLADGSTWDPAGLGISKAYYCGYDGSDYFALWDEDGTIYMSSISTPTLKASELNDTSDPHTLIAAEVKNKILTNSESTGADEWDFPARTEGWNFTFVIEAAQNVTLDPNGTEQWYLNGTQMAAGEAIVNTSPTVGESLFCYSTESDVFCESKYSDFTEASP